MVPSMKKSKTTGKITVSKDGPYLVTGNLRLTKDVIVTGADGDPAEWKEEMTFAGQDSYALCRCGHSKNKPYCDSSHLTAKFDGTETASRKTYLEQAERTSGPGMDLTDAAPFCSGAKFCHRAGGTWDLTERSGDPASRDAAIQEACDCPSGRLVAWDTKTGEPIEPDLEPSIGIVECPGDHVSGPIRVKGGVPVESSDGTTYEVRNRCTLCRCGKSENKPYCDGTHVDIKFDDGDPSLKA